jgi:hypothetical protein
MDVYMLVGRSLKANLDRRLINIMALAGDTAQIPSLLASDETKDYGESPQVYKTHWFCYTYSQAAILGLASFCSPSIWEAMANLGAGGLQSVSTGSAATVRARRHFELTV